jgi:hypothetical protein
VRWLLLFLMTSAQTVLAQQAVPLRAESDIAFTVNESFLDSGGIQYFYQLIRDTPNPETVSASFRELRALDVHHVWSRLSAPTHVVLSRIVYTVDKDITFFSESRVRDLGYINAVGGKMNVTANADGTYRVGKIPSNVFALQYFDERALKDNEDSDVRQAFEVLARFVGKGPAPKIIVAQENRDFSRVMGMRTAEGSFTWTVHQPLSIKKTRITVLTMSYLHTLPPFFLGGEDRVMRESIQGAVGLISRLRAY